MKPISNYAPEAELLLATINGLPFFRFENVDPAIFMELVRLHEMGPLLFRKHSSFEYDFLKNNYSELKSTYLRNTLSNISLWKEFLRIEEAFRQKKIPIVPMKGLDVLTRFYPLFDQRQMSDIDLLVKEEIFDQAESLFYDLGYQKYLEGLKELYWKQHQCHIVFHHPRKKIRVDLHFGLDFKRPDRIFLPHLWERLTTVTTGKNQISLLSPEDALFCFALHWRRFGNILSLKQVLDAARLLRTTPQFDWEYILTESRRGKMKSTIYFILLQASLFCKVKLPKKFLEALNIPSWKIFFMKTLILQYTFKLDQPLKTIFLAAHFLIYDSILEPILYLFHIPYEQFCKFYNLEPYTRKTDLIYRFRIFRMALPDFSEKRRTRPIQSLRTSTCKAKTIEER